MNLYERTGVLRGRYDSNWRSTVSWRCLTGEAQIALVLCRLYNLTGEAIYAETAKSLLNGLAEIQDSGSPHAESYGGLAGSHPLWGGYSPFNYLNWAAKFFMDALLLHLFKVDVQKPRHCLTVSSEKNLQ